MGEAYFKVEGTNHKFNIKARAHLAGNPKWPWRTTIDLSGWGLGQREFKGPHIFIPFTLIIAGSDEYRYLTTMTEGSAGAVGWMNALGDVINPRKLKHVIMPGSHDSGMSTIRHANLASSPNTQTQALNTYQQLKLGIRYFDMRIVRLTFSDVPSFTAAHMNDEFAEDWVGAVGEPWDDIVSGLNRDENNNHHWDEETAQSFYDAVTRINNRCTNIDITEQTMDDRPLSFYTGLNDGAGCVLLINDGSLYDNVTRQVLTKGIYAPQHMDRTDDWSNMVKPPNVAADEISDFHGIRAKNSGKDNFFIDQWFASLPVLETTRLTIQGIAIFMMNPSLYFAGFNGMSPTSFPTVMMQDYVGIVRTDQFAESHWSYELKVLAMGLILYMVNQNCRIGIVKNPLFAKNTGVKTRSLGVGSRFNGIVFANGTVIEHLPPGLDPWKEEIMPKGTVFANGTVLTQDTPVPDWW